MKATLGSYFSIGLALVLGFACAQPAEAVLIFAEDFQGGTVGNDLSTLPGWTAVGDSGSQVIDSEGLNLFATTGGPNVNSASRYDRAFVNPGLTPGTTVIMSMDVFDPSANTFSGVATYARAYGGIFDGGAEFIPPYFGISSTTDAAGNDIGDVAISDYVVSGEGFVNEQFGPSDILAQDTWYSMRAEFKLGDETMTVYAKTRDGVDPFVPIFTNVSTPFADANQDLTLLDTWRQRMNRGARIDNIRVEAVIPEPCGIALLLVGTLCAAVMKRGR